MTKVITTTLLTLFMAINGWTAETRSICVFDILGKTGDQFGIMKDYQAAALAWGYNLNLIPYSDEKVAAEDFKAGQCDAVFLTGVRGRPFNKFSATIEAVGAIPTYKEMHALLAIVSSPKAIPKMTSGPFEVIGVLPGGEIYMFVNDKSINSQATIAGKRIAALDYDKAQSKLIMAYGATPVASDVTNFASKFNNGNVDIIAAPAAAYAPLEIYRGLGENGGILKMSIAQLTLQVFSRSNKFSDAFKQSSREWFVNTEWDKAMSIIDTATKSIPDKYWIKIAPPQMQEFDQLMRDARKTLLKDGIYDAGMLNLEKKIRCKYSPTHSECADSNPY